MTLFLLIAFGCGFLFGSAVECPKKEAQAQIEPTKIDHHNQGNAR